ncbi:hypothetical protein NC797_04850 [Aquibacillus sp. 3ASR75-11]|uniref:Uncharacterized protein n=1 Tax=Terrihalobacillus insolitus TaxID=2950438 RepID=A0A9X3WS49_9BACI|nr:hypothetical protein [Terrihalobacillus insolitus]MDC3412685.1 hypothetical protein [Terrihalobacillus insolitus]MDC3423838.1 hypothetical protein [Terrihalobacillus insolitus]
MGAPIYFIFLTVLILSIVVIAKIVYYRKVIPCMTGMMIAMTMGMSVGLIVGITVGILLSGNIFLSSMFGMTVGMFIGFLSGVPVSLMAVLDGTLSGIMAGMMGAMIGEMVALEYQDTLIKIFFIVFFATMLILLRLIQIDIEKKQTHFLNNPLILVVLFGFIFLVFDQLGPIFR